MRWNVQRLLHDTLAAAAAVTPLRTAVIIEGERHSYSDLLDEARGLARALQDRGVERGDRVAVYLESSWPAVVSVYGVLLAGGVLTVINPQTKEDKLAYILAESGARVLIADGALGKTFVPAIERTPKLGAVIVTGPVPTSRRPLVRFDVAIHSAEPTPDDPGVIPLDLAALIYTSGSTGNPKGVMMTHQSMLFAAGSITEYLRLSADDRILNVLPLAFDYGLYQLLMSVMLGATLVLERSFAFPVPVVKRADEERVTVFPLVPTIAATLLSLRKRNGLELPAVTRVTNTAAALPSDFIPQLAELFPRALDRKSVV